MAETLMVNEIFGPTIQGEGHNNVGGLAYFVRLSGCDSNCKWCDTLQARDINSGTKMTYMEIANEIRKLHGKSEKRVMRIIITGGNPCMQNLELLSEFLTNEFNTDKNENQTSNCHTQICLETQGTLPFPNFYPDYVVFSPKPPSAFENQKNGQDIDVIVDYYNHNISIFNISWNPKNDNDDNTSNIINAKIYSPIIECKIVVFVREDLKYANRVFNELYKVINNDTYYTDILGGNLSLTNQYPFTIQIGTPYPYKKSIKEVITAREIIEYLYSDDCDLDNNMLQKIRVLPQVHRILGVE